MWATRYKNKAAFTLVELMLVIVVAAALGAIALPAYQQYILRAKNSKAVRDIAEISMALEQYRSIKGTFPANLSSLGAALPSADPWGRAYQYLAIDVTPAPNAGAVRKDKNLNPLNSDYDLYSMGPDGLTQKQITAARARDDIVRAGNGAFIGLASEH